METGIEFCLLGPLVVRRGALVVPVPQGNLRTVLAALLLNAGRIVFVDELTEALWADDPPPSARVTVQNHVMRLRKALGTAAARISTQPNGYLIRVDTTELDLHRFEAHLANAREAARDGSWQSAAAEARAGLSLWRGEPLADIDSELLAVRDAPRLTEMRLQAVEIRIDADLHLARHTEVITELRQLTAAHPLRERLHGLLMLALYRDGRQAEALTAYTRARQLVVDELGTEPDALLRELQRQILNGDPALHSLPRPPGALGPPAHALGVAESSAPRVPRQLPAAVSGFTGRGAELAALTRMLDDGSPESPGTVVISAIGGTAGVGKTALALHWAHQVAARFPDGQLYVNLRGFDPSGVPMAAAEAVRVFLDALGVPPDRVPAQPEARAGLYRSLLADRGMLIVLDNARDEQQVRPLLPASPASLVIVTSRNQLGGLAAADRARLLTLDVLGHDDAVDMLTARVGASRATAEPAAAAEIVSLCGRLPLALAVAAARAETRPGFPLTALAAELRDRARLLEALDAGDPAASVRAVFSWSYRQLSAEAARMFRLLGLHPGPDISVPAAASLAAAAELQARRLLAELSRAYLVAEHVPGRYALHDLLRAYATDQARNTDSQPERAAATGRVVDHYLRTARDAAAMVHPSFGPIPLAPPSPGIAPEQFTAGQRALAWFEAEIDVLLAAMPFAVDWGLDIQAWQISLVMHPFLATRGHNAQWTATKRMLMAASIRDDAAMVASGARDTAGTLGDYQWVPEYYASLVELYQQLGNRRGQAVCLYALAAIAEYQGQYAEALSYAEQAAGLFRGIGDKAGEAELLNAAGWYHALLGDYQQARALGGQALALNARHGSRHLEGDIWNSLGYTEYHAGDFGEAVACYERALGIFRTVGDCWGEADTLSNLGDVRRAAGELPQAREAWQQALAILDDREHPDAAKVRAKLADMGS
jgi:DNA-binding SARP family transcriptional activator/tetratricopeptide (TPR) repeat protein